MYVQWNISQKKEWNLTICNSMDGPRGYCTKWNKSVRERQMPCNFTHLWNVKNKINEQTVENDSYRERFDGCQRGKGVEELGKRWRDQEVQIGSYKVIIGI